MALRRRGCPRDGGSDGCPRDGGSRRMSPRRRIQTDVPETEEDRDGGSRRMSPRRRIQTYVPETFQTDVPETEGPDGCP